MKSRAMAPTMTSRTRFSSSCSSDPHASFQRSKTVETPTSAAAGIVVTETNTPIRVLARDSASDTTPTIPASTATTTEKKFGLLMRSDTGVIPDPNAEERDTGEFPKWVGDEIARTRAEEDAILARRPELAVEARGSSKNEPIQRSPEIAAGELAEFRAWKAAREKEANRRPAPLGRPDRKKRKPIHYADDALSRDRYSKNTKCRRQCAKICRRIKCFEISVGDFALEHQLWVNK